MSLNRREFLQLLALAAGYPLFGEARARSLPEHTGVIPSSGEVIPAIGLGSWITFGIDPEDEEEMAQRERIMREFLGRGGGMLDSSPMYGNAQDVIGRCLKRIGHHEGLFSATKVWVQGERQGLLQMRRSQDFWGLPRLDLMQVHNLLDWETHLPTLYGMKAEGQIRYVGVTTSHGRRHREIASIMRKNELDFVQLTYNVLDREAEEVLLPLAADRGIAVIINRPFQRGGLFNHVGSNPLPEWADEIDCQNWAQFFLKFIISHPAVTCAIPATSRVDHLVENMGAAYGRLPDQAMRLEMAKYVGQL
jgi:diketogulonate reductase-like aldo/keto reductase